MADLFEQASKTKMRFTTIKGEQSTEELWDMPLINSKTNFSLDALACDINRQIKETGEESFVLKKTKKNDLLETKLEIVKHIIKVRLAEVEERKNAGLKKEKAEQLDRLIYDKQNDALRETPLEDLIKMRNELKQ